MISTVKKLKDELADYRIEHNSIKKSISHGRYARKKLHGNHDSNSNNHWQHQHNRPRINIKSKFGEQLKHGKRKRSDQFGRRLGGEYSVSLNDEGIDFKAKLIGMQDVDNARGDLMCQRAMQSCKAAIKRSGHRKQRIWFNLSANGFKVKDQNTEIVLLNFPISKISFIAKDITDDRAFGFVYEGLEAGKFKFYAIKTDKTADYVVLDIRTVFQLVYETAKQKREKSGWSPKTSGDRSLDENFSSSFQHRRSSDAKSDADDSPTPAQKSYRKNVDNISNNISRAKSLAAIDNTTNQIFSECNDLINLENNYTIPRNIENDLFSTAISGQSTTESSVPKSSGSPQQDLGSAAPLNNSPFDPFGFDEMKNALPAAAISKQSGLHDISPTAEVPKIPPRSGSALPRPEVNKQKSLNVTSNFNDHIGVEQSTIMMAATTPKLLPPPSTAVGRNITSAQTDSKAPAKLENDPFEDDFFK